MNKTKPEMCLILSTGRFDYGDKYVALVWGDEQRDYTPKQLKKVLGIMEQEVIKGTCTK